MQKHRDKILELRVQGKTYTEISAELGCSKSTVSYHCGEGQKEKNQQRKIKNRNTNLLSNKIHSFRTRSTRRKRDYDHRFRDKSMKALHNRLYKFKRRQGSPMKEKFGVVEFFERYGDCSSCYLTGRPIDINDPTSYTFDHKVPITRNGDNSLANLGICRPEANEAKGAHLIEEFLELCKDTLKHHGYKVKKKLSNWESDPTHHA